MVTVLRNLWGAGLAAGLLCIAADIHAQDVPPAAPPAPSGDVVPGPTVPDSLRSKAIDPSAAAGQAQVGTSTCGQVGCSTCRKKSCCLCGGCLFDALACCESCINKHHLEWCCEANCLEQKLAELHCAGDGLHNGLCDLIRKDCEYKKKHLSREYLTRRYGYFFPQGSCGEGTPILGHYHMGYAVNPYHFDPRDAGVYAAQGYGAPMAVPLPPNVEHTYNYGWGIPSSRLTGIYRYYNEPGIVGPPANAVARGMFAGSYTGMYSADRFAPPAGAKPIKPAAPPAEKK